MIDLKKSGTPSEADVLKEALNLVRGPKRDEYGDSVEANENIAMLYRAYFGDRTGNSINATDVSIMGVLEKIARTKMGKHNLHHYIDMAGHAGVAGHVEAVSVEREAEQEELSRGTDERSEHSAVEEIITPRGHGSTYSVKRP